MCMCARACPSLHGIYMTMTSPCKKKLVFILSVFHLKLIAQKKEAVDSPLFPFQNWPFPESVATSFLVSSSHKPYNPSFTFFGYAKPTDFHAQSTDFTISHAYVLSFFPYCLNKQVAA